MNETKVDISVIIAAYNEEAVIVRNLNRVITELETRPNITWEVICVNDGSSDHTGTLIDQLATGQPGLRTLHHRRNYGQGRALRTAFNVCQGELVVTLDADLSYGPEYIFRLTDELIARNVEIALASPYTRGGSVQNVPFYRHFLSRMGNFYLARMSSYDISTSTCVVRAYRREVVEMLALNSDGMELQLEILMKAHIENFRICEIPADLRWEEVKKEQAAYQRVSKMRILRTIQIYLMMGWLSRPALAIILFAALLLIPGLYMALVLLFRIVQAFLANLSSGIIWGFSYALQEVFTKYTYSIVVSGALVLIGIQLLAFAMLMLQMKFYFEETYHLQQERRR